MPELNENVAALIEAIQDEDPEVRYAAWRSTPEVGAEAVAPLAELLTDENVEVVRAANRGLWHLVRRSGRPGADQERAAVAAALIEVLEAEPPAPVQREVVWLLGEAGGEAAVPPVSALLDDPELRDDARMALEMIPEPAAVQALEAALPQADEAFQPALAHSLQVRGVDVDAPPSQKLAPVAQTSVQPVPADS